MTNAPDNDIRLNDLLSAHLDTLLAQDYRAASRLANTAPPEVRDLMTLATTLDSAFLAVAPSPEFLSRLRADFVQESTSRAFVLRWRKLPPRYQTAAKVGGATLTVGLVLLAARRAAGLFATTRARQRPTTDPLLMA